MSVDKKDGLPESRSTSTDGQRERIVDTALALFAEQGERATSLRRVAEEAGVSLGALQHYFRTKPDLRHAVELRVMERFQEQQADAFLLGDDQFREFLELGLRNYFAFARKYPKVTQLGSRWALETPDHTMVGEEELGQEVLRRIQAAQDLGHMRPCEPVMVMMMVELVMNAWAAYGAHFARHLPEHVSAEERDERFVEFAMSVLWLGLGARE